MFKEKDQMVLDVRENMRGGNGSVQMMHVFNQSEMKGKCRMFARIQLDPGCSIGPHVHDGEEEIYYVLSGKGTITDNGIQRDIGPGEALLTGGGESHSIENTGTEPLIFMAAINLFA